MATAQPKQSEPGRREAWAGPFVWACLGAALVLRLWIAWSADFLVHPDEIFQYFEQAHRLVFGAGFVPWEFVLGTRSWLVPGALAAPLWALDALGLGRPEVYVPALEALLCLASLCVPLGMYRYVRAQWSERAGRLALVFGCLWWELAVFGHRAMQGILATDALLLALGALPALGGTARSRRSAAALGALLALGVVVRMQYALPAGLIGIYALRRARRDERAAGLLAALGIALASGALDWWTLGAPFQSYTETFRINIELGIAATMGVSGPDYYFAKLAGASLGLAYLAFALAFADLRRSGELLLLAAVVIAVHLPVDHKEYRFVYLLVPLWLSLLAAQIERLASGDGRAPSLRAGLALAGALATLALAVTGWFSRIPGQPRLYQSFLRPVESYFETPGDLSAYLFLNRQPDLAGVLDAATPHWAETGGYYFLHRAVPLYHNQPIDPLAFDTTRVQSLVSHIVTGSDIDALPGFERLAEFEDARVWRSLAEPVWTWEHFAPVRGNVPEKDAEQYLVRLVERPR